MTKIAQSLVLLSSGLDSTTNLYMEKSFYSVGLALTIDYGQKAAQREIACSKKICESLHVKHQVLSLDFFKEIGKNCSLLNKNKSLPQLAEGQSLEDFVQDKARGSVWVPNRNGVFIAVASAYAEALGLKRVVVGFNAEEATLFPDNSADFLDVVNRSLFFSSANEVQVVSHTLSMNKKEILKRAKKLGVHLDWIWPCYLGENTWCGQCESCKRFEEAKAAIVAAEEVEEAAH